jgi:hypothetical protein
MGRYSIVWVLSIPLAAACARTTIGGNGEADGLACETDLDCPGRERCDANRCVPVPDNRAGGATG